MEEEVKRNNLKVHAHAASVSASENENHAKRETCKSIIVKDKTNIELAIKGGEKDRKRAERKIRFETKIELTAKGNNN